MIMYCDCQTVTVSVRRKTRSVKNCRRLTFASYKTLAFVGSGSKQRTTSPTECSNFIPLFAITRKSGRKHLTAGQKVCNQCAKINCKQCKSVCARNANRSTSIIYDNGICRPYTIYKHCKILFIWSARKSHS